MSTGCELHMGMLSEIGDSRRRLSQCPDVDHQQIPHHRSPCQNSKAMHPDEPHLLACTCAPPTTPVHPSFIPTSRFPLTSNRHQPLPAG
nr:hypothetical protein CFP56_04415 [Quercus suber]